ncbi:hypothetical protein H9N28_13235 [Rhodobacter capsulatus]|uniref:Peptidase inhibitor I78 family protein n=1 Tax=Rhodobacter capsulatus TaxID=1061 RepID=A0A0Q0R2T2_RHOCA|nr:hypothetical protein [Rhodobacter capsulatus]KQB16544.1 hypothetical protein AP073_11035 [Rhodobacter capsulatus]KQB17055.1 hypothetical protein AP071_10860 [Rhodobacter capsulatus]PZX21843.1 peptidase inhibitor I78 family protein [Rhodobacter capsulatus]QNR62517.1 hypothetical protein H9N28_13235 [Rhodobacter capsulatus]WER08559.1 hypothetical protein PUH89_14755 [Rhodobacter capsulatus]
MLTKYALLALAALSLTACGPSPEEEAAAEPAPVPHLTQPVFQTGVLENRSPDTCHAARYASALGQPATIIPTLGIADPVNVIEWRGIEPQEYNSHRVVFRLDPKGNIFNIDCG